MTPDTLYVAIFHVWADGLGNPVVCYILRCPLSHIWKLAHKTLKSISVLEDAMSEEGLGGSEPSRIWLDTLCCLIWPPEA